MTDGVLVDCVVRSDAPTKPGGDSVQIKEYDRYLRQWGADLREVPFDPAMRLRPGAIVHVFNVDRPYEFVLAARAARGHRLVVSPIHHRIERVRAMRAADRGRGVVSLAGRVLPEAVREWAATAVRASRSRPGAAGLLAGVRTALVTAPLVPDVWRAAGRELDRAEAVALLAEGEGADLRALTGWRASNAVLVPNGRPEALDLDLRRDWADRPVGSIVVIGRIEPRKRQLEVARQAHALGVPVTFVGQRANAGDAYTAAFDALAASSPSVTYGGALGRPEVLRLMGSSRVLLNASWVEVQSLVDLEAAFMGCAVVTSPTGHSAEWLGDAVTVQAADDPAALLREAARIAALDEGPAGPPDYDWSWERSSARLREVYERGVPA